ncbi:MAG TPA: ankyrin repeat domain-containing protein [Gemmatimonadaceae bacterium]|nr:ankyrin repeat domain-containing protein [Gemmatimonadaceae bacterium]
MNRTQLAALICIVAAGPVHGQDTRKAMSLKLPAPKTSAVADAAMRGDDGAVKKLIAQGADVNVAQGDGMTALHWAAEHGDAELASALIKAHASLKATTRIGAYTPLHIAAKSGNPNVINELLEAGSDAKAMTATGATALHFAAAAGNPEAVELLIKAGADPNLKEAAWGQTPLVFAAEFNRADAIKVLLKNGADVSVHTRVQSVQEETAREQAAEKKRNEVLLSFEPKAVRDSIMNAFKRDSAAQVAQQATAAQDAANSGYGNAVQQQARVSFGRGPRTPQPKGPFTPSQIQIAIDSGRTVLLDPKSAKGPAVEQVDTLNGGVAGFANAVGGVGGLSALDHAVRQGNLASVVALLDGGANINDATVVDHTTPLNLAVINGQFDVAMELIKRGADPNLAATNGMTPLYAAINTQWAPKSRYPQPEAIQVQKTSYLELMKALLDAKANPNMRLTAQPWYFAYNNCGNANCGLENIEGTTAFWRAAYAVDVDAMKLLVKYGADPNLPSQRVAAAGGRGGRGGGGRRGGGGGGGGGGGAPGDSAGGAARAPRGGGGGRGQIAAPILDPEIDSAAKAVPPGIGVYPIHAAAGVGYGNGFAGNSHRHAPDGWMPAMRYLVEELHADVNARDNNGYTPLHHAAARGDNEMILYLVAHGADVRAVARNGRTTLDMANGPVQRLSPIPDTIKLLEKLGAKNTHHCVSCW